MLTIRSPQLKVLGKVPEEGYAMSVARYLRNRFPQELEGVSDADLGNLVTRGIARASSHGFVSEREVTRYLMLMLFLGPEFDTDPKLSH